MLRLTPITKHNELQEIDIGYYGDQLHKHFLLNATVVLRKSAHGRCQSEFLGRVGDVFSACIHL